MNEIDQNPLPLLGIENTFFVIVFKRVRNGLPVKG